MLKKLILVMILTSTLSLNTVLAICHYEVSLKLEPSTIISGGSVTPSATICCDAPARVYFSEGECDIFSPLSSCVIQANTCSCVGSPFSAPSEAGNYNYVACVDKNGDGIVGNIPGEAREAILTVKGCISTDTSSEYPLGNDIFMKGITTCPGREFKDECLDKERLKEFYCTSTDYCEYKIINCNHWVNTECGDGKCYCVSDLNDDKKVNILDIAKVARAYGSDSVVNTKKWDPRADLDLNGKIDIMDIFKVALKIGKDCNIEKKDVPESGPVSLGLGYYNVVVILITAIVMVLFFGAFKIFGRKK
ncbi:MAG: hypothetical protein QMD36_03910 [Candidatus Aenigmarchaeota archaeon]|nr:hypothetical protein [Candidatus Aenigmarchaeota archaeon]